MTGPYGARTATASIELATACPYLSKANPGQNHRANGEANPGQLWIRVDKDYAVFEVNY